jgi:excisionase family DNA binding protein
MDQLVSIGEAEAIAGVCRRTIYNWLAKNKIQFVRTAGGNVRIYAASLWKTGNVDPQGAEHAAESSAS